MPKTLTLVILAIAVCSCAKPEPLTEAKAQQLIESQMFKSEPVYAEVPQRVQFGPNREG